ncbi:MAG TPA: HAMP domain-containing sensor histidine kinase, partial [Gemmataceae bacterium]|nr:HAMP domain-containing sensor histidine kinase [Gemmataceae bacterium]
PMTWLRGKLRAFLLFLGIAALLLGGLGWATRAALKVEDDQRLAAANAAEAERLYLAQKEQADRLRLALWRLDSRMAPALAREESRPYPQYVAMHTPFPALTGSGIACAPGQVFLPSPLLTAEVPDWMRLHFQVDQTVGWTSPQVIPEGLQKDLRKQPIELALNNVTPERAELLASLKERFPAASIMATFRQLGITATENAQEAQRWTELTELVNSSRLGGRGGNFNSPPGPPGPTPDNNTAPKGEKQEQQTREANPSQNPYGGFNYSPQLDYAYRVVFTSRARREGQWAYIFDDNRATMPLGLGGAFPAKSGLTYQTVEVQLGSMRPVWLPSAEQPEYLLMVRGAKVGEKPVYQGFVVDWAKLLVMLQDEVSDLFPDAKFAALPPGEPPHPDRAMSALPVEFDPALQQFPPSAAPVDPESLPPPGWTPLRIGLAIAWVSVLVALLAVGLGGRSLLDLSERRIRFVSAVTHELRTPLTTLRLYLDLLSSGMVSEEKQKTEYLTTLNAEADRLHRLIGNVLDFARLEKSRPDVVKRPTEVSGLLEQLNRNWHERCAAAGKDLVVENRLPEGASVTTDPGMVEQIVGNLIDNAQKYSRDATDPKIVLRALAADGRLAIEVEDRGPGVTKRERCSIFRPFRRGHDADVKAGGVGLGLALATRWAQLLGGTLGVGAGGTGIGACFRLELPGLQASGARA